MKIRDLAAAVIIISCLSYLGTPFTALGQDLGGPVRVSPYQLSQLAASGNNVYVLYQQNSQNGVEHVYFTQSSDTGKSFENPIDLGPAVEPLISTYGDNVYLAWETGATGWPPSHVMFSKSDDGGKTFGSPVMISDISNSSSVITQLLSDGKHLFALIDEFDEKLPYQSETVLMTSRDNGTTWDNKTDLLPYAVLENSGYGPSVTEVGNKIVFVGEKKLDCENPNYCQYAIFRRTSTDMGSTFGPELDIAKSWNPVRLQIKYSAENIYVAWVDGPRGEGPSLYFAKSNDGGSTFSTPVVISQNDGESDWPHMEAIGKTVYIIWQYNNENVIAHAHYSGIFPPTFVSGIFYAKSTDGGNAFSQPVNLSGDIGTSYFSEMSSSNGHVYVGWTSIHGGFGQEFFDTSSDNGTTFENPTTPTGASDAGFSQIASSGDNVYIAGTAASGNIVWLKASNDDGKDFGPLINLNHGSGTITTVSPLVLCCAAIADQPWFQNGWAWTGIGISAVIGSWIFLFRRFKGD